ncbi:hypothetical protein [Amorphus sp. MBR-141]
MADPTSRPSRPAAPAPLWAGERVTREHLTFAAPFRVEGPLGECPAGTFEVETVEELIDGLSFPVYRIVSTSVVLPVPRAASSARQMVRLDPALVRAARAASGPVEPS